MLVGWLKVRRTDYETFEKQKLCHMRYLLFLDIWSADPSMLILGKRSSDYRNTPLSYNLGQNQK